MPRRPDDIVKVLQGKFGFSRAPSRSHDHDWYELQLPGLPTILTKFSHSKKDIGPKLEGKIARQLRVPKPFFNEMMDCTKGPAEYEHQVRTHPVPPFDVRF